MRRRTHSNVALDGRQAVIDGTAQVARLVFSEPSESLSAAIPAIDAATNSLTRQQSS